MAHAAGVAFHHFERSADVRRQVDLIDHEQIGTRDARPAFTRDLVSARDINTLSVTIIKRLWPALLFHDYPPKSSSSLSTLSSSLATSVSMPKEWFIAPVGRALSDSCISRNSLICRASSFLSALCLCVSAVNLPCSGLISFGLGHYFCRFLRILTKEPRRNSSVVRPVSENASSSAMAPQLIARRK